LSRLSYGSAPLSLSRDRSMSPHSAEQ
jgi:hypothetical protein